MSFLQGLFGPPKVSVLYDKRDIKGLLKALEHKDPNIRMEAAHYLSRMSPDITDIALRTQIIEAIVAAIPSINWAGILPLKNLYHPDLDRSIRRQMAEYFVARSGECRSHADIQTMADGLGQVASEFIDSNLHQGIVSTIYTAINAGEAVTQEKALFALSACVRQSRDDEFKAAVARNLRPLLSSGPAQNRIATLDVYECLGPMSTPYLIEHLRNNHPAVQAKIVQILKTTGWKPGKDELGVVALISEQKWKEVINLGNVAFEPLLFYISQNKEKYWRLKGAINALGELSAAPKDTELVLKLVNLLIEMVKMPIPRLEDEYDDQETVQVLQVLQQLSSLHDAPFDTTQFGKDLEGKIEPKRRDLDKMTSASKQEIIQALGKIGLPDAVPILIAILANHAPPDIKKASEAAILQIGPSAIGPLAETMTGSKESDTRRIALEMLAKIDSPASIPYLINLLDHQVLDVQIAAGQALSKTGWKPEADRIGINYLILRREWENCVKLGNTAIPQLIQASQTQKGSIQAGAVETLGKLVNPKFNPAIDERLESDIINALYTLLQQHKTDGAHEAVYILGKIGDARAVEPLIAALQDKDAGVRKTAAEALGQIGDARAVEPLIAALKGGNSFAAKALGQIGDARAVDPLIAALKDGEWLVREAATEALGRIGDVRAVEPLLYVFEDRNGNVRRVAAAQLLNLYRLGNLTETQKQKILAQRRAIQTQHKDSTVSHSDSIEYPRYHQDKYCHSFGNHTDDGGKTHTDHGGHTDKGIGLDFPL